MFRALVCMFVSASVALADPPKLDITTPAAPAKWEDKEVVSGKWVYLNFSTKGVQCYLAEDTESAMLFNVGDQWVFFALKDGPYKIMVVNDTKEVSRYKLWAGVKPTPVPPVPNPPNPNPNPPAPNPPQPSNALKDLLRTALEGDKGSVATKKAIAADLGQLYKDALKLANDKTITTFEDLAIKMQASSENMVGKDVAMGLRTAIAEYLTKDFGDPGALTDTGRAKIAAAFQLLSDTLNTLEVTK